MTSSEIQKALVGYGTNCMWSPLRVLAVRNSTGVAGWEADLLVIQPTNWAYEVEIKVSVSDFRREFTQKTEKHRALVRGWKEGYNAPKTIVRRFFFAMPDEIYQKVKDEIPEYCGVITFSDERRDRHERLHPHVERKPKQLPCRQITDADRLKVLMSVYHRSWNLMALDIENEKLMAPSNAMDFEEDGIEAVLA